MPTKSLVSNLGYKLFFISFALFLAFISIVITGIFPLAFLDPAWQLRFCSLLVENAALPLVGMAILHGAVYVNGDNLSLKSVQLLASRSAILVVLGFFLLVPLQVSAVLRIYATQAQGAPGSQQSAVLQRLEDMRRIINGSTSSQDLQARLSGAGGPLIPDATLATPLPLLRSRLLASLEQARINALEQIKRAQPGNAWNLVQQSLRIIISALGYGVGFAASAQKSGSGPSLLQQWHKGLQARRRASASSQGKRRRKRKGILRRFKIWTDRL